MEKFITDAAIYQKIEGEQLVHVRAGGVLSVSQDGKHVVVGTAIKGENGALLAVLSVEQAADLIDGLFACLSIEQAADLLDALVDAAEARLAIKSVQDDAQ